MREQAASDKLPGSAAGAPVKMLRGNPQGNSEYFGSSGVLGVAYGTDNWISGDGNAAIQDYSSGTVDIFAG